MILKNLKIQNIRSYEELEIEFPVGSLLLSGDIGAGKTSILLAIQFALFGLQPGQKGASILRQGCDNAYVFLEFEINNNKIILERTLKQAKSGSITQEKNTIEINGEKQELSTSEMKTKVIDLLKYPKEFVKKSNLLYKFTVYTPQEEMKSIIQERPEIRLDTLRHIFGIDRYKRIKENCQILIQKIKESIKIKESQILEINSLKEKLKQQTERKILLSKELNNLTIENSTLEKEKQEIQNNLKELESKKQEKQNIDKELSKNQIQLQSKKQEKQRLEKEITSMKLQIKETIDYSDDKLKSTSELLQKHKDLLEELNKKYLESNSKISVLNSKKENSLEMKNKIISLENCPTCFQKVAQEHKDKISKRTQYDLEEIERELELKLFDKNQLIKDIEKEKELVIIYEKDKNQLEADKIRFQHQKTIDTKIKSDAIILDRTFTEIKTYEETIKQLEEEIQKYQDIDLRFNKIKSQFDTIDIELNTKRIKIAERNKELELLKIQIEELQKNIQEKESIRQQLNYLKGLQDWLQEKFISMITITETKVLTKLRSEFSSVFSNWFTILVSDSLTVRLDEDFSPIIQNQDYEIEYDFLSGGERTAVALAYRLALNQILNSLLSHIQTKDIIILDEPTDGFSAEQLDKMRDIFQELTAEQIILVSHEQKIEGFVDNVIKIKKQITSGIDEEVNP